jgi:hypothetical protein
MAATSGVESMVADLQSEGGGLLNVAKPDGFQK